MLIHFSVRNYCTTIYVSNYKKKLKKFHSCLPGMSAYIKLIALTVIMCSYISLSKYCKIANISHTKTKTEMFFVSACSCLCAIYWRQVLSEEWRCSWSRAHRQCFNYISIINNWIIYWSVPYITDYLKIYDSIIPFNHNADNEAINHQQLSTF